LPLVLQKIGILSQMISDFSADSEELLKFSRAENAALLHKATKSKLFETVPVCLNCMRIYLILSDLYTKLEESSEDQPIMQKNIMFLGLDERLNEKVQSMLKRQVERSRKRPLSPTSI